MTSEQAKFILSACRPGGSDAGDPTVAEALEQVRRDPELAAWFERERAHARAMGAKLGSIQPPEGLREAILAGAHATGRIGRRRHLFPIPVALAAAASVAVILTFMAGRKAEPAAPLVPVPPVQTQVPAPAPDATAVAMVPDLDQLVSFVVADAVRGKHAGGGKVAADLRMALADPVRHLREEIPIDFNALVESGCRIVDYGGADIVEVCFSRENARFHLFALRNESCATLGLAEKSGVTEGWSYVTWANASHRFVIVSNVSPAALARQL